jgi:hypothetical protein
MIVIHESRTSAVQAQPLMVTTFTRTVPPVSARSTRRGSTSNRHGAPSCASSIRVSSMLNAPRRGFGVAFALTWTATVSSPCPVVRSGTIHCASDVIVQLHSRPAAIEMVPEPPGDGNELGVGLAVIAHFAAVGAVALIDEDEELQPSTVRVRSPRTASGSRTIVREGQTVCQPASLDRARRAGSG